MTTTSDPPQNLIVVPDAVLVEHISGGPQKVWRLPVDSLPRCEDPPPTALFGDVSAIGKKPDPNIKIPNKAWLEQRGPGVSLIFHGSY